MTTEDRETAWWTAGRHVLARELYRAAVGDQRLDLRRLVELLDSLAPGWNRRKDLGGLPEPGP